jgi:flagellar biosynthesis/type III secretory pathway protein FliH
MHDQREKAQRDYDWMLSTARKQGIEQGIEKGREEGAIIGAIQALQQILGDSISAGDTLAAESFTGLQAKLADLQSRVRSRLSS